MKSVRYAQNELTSPNGQPARHQSATEAISFNHRHARERRTSAFTSGGGVNVNVAQLVDARCRVIVVTCVRFFLVRLPFPQSHVSAAHATESAAKTAKERLPRDVQLNENAGRPFGG